MNILENLPFIPEYRDPNNNPFNLHRVYCDHLPSTGYLFNQSFTKSSKRYLQFVVTSAYCLSHSEESITLLAHGQGMVF